MTNHINLAFKRISPELVSHASELQSAILADVNGRRGAMHGRITALRPGMKIAGSALTVDVRPGDNLMIHAAIELAKPGDVLVIDGKGDQTAALMGAIMMTACQQRGIAGAVIDGAVRDSLEICELEFPVFCVGTNPNGPTKNIPGRIGQPIACGGITVRSGDLILADADGVVAVEHERVESLLPLAHKKVREEDAFISAIKLGTADSSWVHEALRRAGVLGPAEAL